MKIINVILIGHGSIGSKFSDEIKKNKQFNLENIITTRNKNLIKLNNIDLIIICSPINTHYKYLLKAMRLNKDIIILCAGWKNDFCTEDTLFAGALIEQLKETNNFQCSSDSCSMASLIYNTAKEDMFAFLENSQHRRRLAHLNIINDVSYCLKRDQTNVIPIVVDNQIEAYK